ncbi:Iron-sulfur cluster repair protein YtfE [Shewanella sp. P1-14-1]|nr:Iron-sulfur cluster repair protein YtfE [Shewanella sp. P1-14-1]
MPSTRFEQLQALPIPALIDHLEATHHQYVRETAPLLVEYSQKMVQAHGEDYAEIKPLAMLIGALIADLMPHLMKEEQILFPAMRRLAAGEEVNGCFGHIGNPINAMEHEHDHAGSVLQQLRELTNNYQVPERACSTWQKCYQTLAEFDADLQVHIHTENELLFPKALAI